jgi:hypothetical protein
MTNFNSLNVNSSNPYLNANSAKTENSSRPIIQRTQSPGNSSSNFGIGNSSVGSKNIYSRTIQPIDQNTFNGSKNLIQMHNIPPANFNQPLPVYGQNFSQQQNQSPPPMYNTQPSHFNQSLPVYGQNFSPQSTSIQSSAITPAPLNQNQMETVATKVHELSQYLQKIAQYTDLTRVSEEILQDEKKLREMINTNQYDVKVICDIISENINRSNTQTSIYGKRGAPLINAVAEPLEKIQNSLNEALGFPKQVNLLNQWWANF